jgi:hypothetical protein
MKPKLGIAIMLIAWFAVIMQYYLMLENRVAPVAETNLRFFSFFTILTNILVAVYFTMIVLNIKNRSVNAPGTLTAITLYISVVGLVYQLVLRQLWTPTGMQRIVDEMLHSVVPVLVIIYWYLYENKSLVGYKQIPRWLAYPLIYLFYILIRGIFAGFYPYPFVDVVKLGLQKVLENSVMLMLLFIGLAAIFIKIGKVTSPKP